MRRSKRLLTLGLGLTEVVVGIGILLTVIVGAHSFALQNIDFGETTYLNIRAGYLLLESADVVKILRDDSWSANIASLALDTDHYLVWDSGAWEITTSPSLIDGLFDRTVSLSSVERDANDNIVDSGILDPGTLKLTATVLWQNNRGTSTKALDTYITDLYQN